MVQSGWSAAETFQRAFQHHQSGRLAEAETLYRQVVTVNPRHADSFHLLGIIARQTGRPALAVDYVDKAIKIQPRAAAYHVSRGNALRDLGRLTEAKDCYRTALRLQPDFHDALSNLGGLLVESGQFPEAETICRKSVRARSDYNAQVNLGLALAGLERLEEAEASFREAIRLKPDGPEAHNHLGRALDRLGRTQEAEASFEKALRLRPDFADARNNLGGIYKKHGRTEAALACFQNAVHLKPDFPEALINLADLLSHLNRSEEAETHANAAVRLKPESPEAHNSLGLALSALGRHAEAEASYRDALRLNPGFAAGHNNLGNALHELGQLEEAEASYREALRLAPGDPDASKGLARMLLSQRKFGEAASYLEQALAKLLEAADSWRALLGMQLYVPDISPAERFRRHSMFGHAMAARAKTQPLPSPTNDRTPERRLRVGWLSSDFHLHPVARNLDILFTHRDRASFEAFCYADVKKPDSVTEAFRGKVDKWQSITGLTDAAVAEMIRADGIDIMIYPAGHFDENRPQVAAWRPAPVQISVFDTATSGLAEMDYFFADRVVAPAHRFEQFSERVFRLPSCYLHPPPFSAPEPGSPPCLAGTTVTFASFHNPMKLHPQVFKLWAEVLRRLPQARLHFQYMDAFAKRPLQDAIRRDFGEDVVDRISFGVRKRTMGGHLELYNEVDISLDPFPFTGSTATFEALLMGVPVVTLLGDTVVSRWSASMLSKVGLDDLIAPSQERYVEIAVHLATDRDRLADLRRTLRDRLIHSSICRGAPGARHFERALRAVWRKWCRDGNQPRVPAGAA